MELVDDRIVCCDLKYTKEETKKYLGIYEAQREIFCTAESKLRDLNWFMA